MPLPVLNHYSRDGASIDAVHTERESHLFHPIPRNSAELGEIGKDLHAALSGLCGWEMLAPTYYNLQVRTHVTSTAALLYAQ